MFSTSRVTRGVLMPHALVISWALMGLTGATAEPLRWKGSRPNILFVMTDDQGYWDTGVTGNPHIDTPTMDALAASGVQFDRYYAAMVCAPTRAGWMTGRHYLRTGLYNTRFGGDSLGLDEVTFAEILRDAGYRTGLFGKWHLGKYPGYQPQDRGWDQFFGHYHGHIERYQHPDQLFHNGQPVQARGYVTDLFTSAAIDFMAATVQQGTPFLCAVTYNAPHSPFVLDTSHRHQPEGDLLIDKYLNRGLPLREARIYAMVERIDENLARLIQHLNEADLRRETLVAFVSDNGGVSRFEKCGMRGQKAGTYEGGTRTPCFVSWPGRIAGGIKITSQTSHLDWLPTFCDLAGAVIPEDRVIDGKSLLTLLHSGQSLPHHPRIYQTWDRYTPNPDRRWSISEQRWKLQCQIGSTSVPGRQHWHLFDLENDPGESTNLAKQHPETVERLRDEFVRWFEEVTEGQAYAPIRIPVGIEGHPCVELSPSWATVHGENIQYVFDGYDWDTIEGWREPGEKATWELDVRSPGSYRLQVSYGSSESNAGGCLRWSVLRAEEATAVEGTVSCQHRIEATSTADQFDVFEAGCLDLPAGKLTLVASVQECRTTEVVRLRHVRLVRESAP
ncbi:MAG: arylsulfatase [Planctomycetota bacterium]